MGSVIVLVVGFVLLVVGANKFVEGASIFAKKLGIPSLIIGLTIVAFGTSAPELAVSFTAGLNESTEIAIERIAIYDTVLLTIVSGVLYIIAKKDWFGRKSCRGIGFGMIATYIMYTAWIIVR